MPEIRKMPLSSARSNSGKRVLSDVDIHLHKACLSRASQSYPDVSVRLNGSNEASSFIKRLFVNPRVLPLVSSGVEYTF